MIQNDTHDAITEAELASLRAHARAALAAELRTIAGRIGWCLRDPVTDRHGIAEAAQQLHCLAVALAAGGTPVAALDAAQLETVLDALDDAAGYQQLRSPASCTDCSKADPARCDDHGRDEDLTRLIVSRRCGPGRDGSEPGS